MNGAGCYVSRGQERSGLVSPITQAVRSVLGRLIRKGQAIHSLHLIRAAALIRQTGPIQMERVIRAERHFHRAHLSRSRLRAAELVQLNPA